MAVKLNGEMAYTNPSNGRYSTRLNRRHQYCHAIYCFSALTSILRPNCEPAVARTNLEHIER